MYWAQKTCSTLDGVFIVSRPRPQHNKEIPDTEHWLLTCEDTWFPRLLCYKTCGHVWQHRSPGTYPGASWAISPADSLKQCKDSVTRVTGKYPEAIGSFQCNLYYNDYAYWSLLLNFQTKNDLVSGDLDLSPSAVTTLVISGRSLLLLGGLLLYLKDE